MQLIHFPQPEPQTVANLLDGFLLEMAASGASEHTVRAYRLDLQRFSAWYTDPLFQLQPAQLVRYLASLAKEGLAETTQARHRASLSEFLSWCDRQGVLVANPMGKLKPLKTAERLPRPIPADELQKLTRQIKKLNLRERTLFMLLLETGMRIGEALGLDWEDVNLSPGQEEVRVFGKRKKERVIPLLFEHDCRNLLRSLQLQDGFTTGAVFRTGKENERRMHYTSAVYHWNKLLETAGVTGHTLHALRHTCATYLYAQGVDLGMIRRLLGHAKMQTTEVYTKVDTSQLREELRKAVRGRK